MPSGAEASYRGYRRQALYALYRMLVDGSAGAISYLPEGGEDLACASAGVITEINQVKSRGEALTLSSFRPQNKDSFFNRVALMLSDNPALKIRVVTYGPVGPQLHGACIADGEHRRELVRKLASYNYLTEQQAAAIFANLELAFVDEDELLQCVREKLLMTLTAVDYESALDFLFYYVFKCSEFGRAISGNDLRDVIHDIGKFVAYRAAHHQEWYTTIYGLLAPEWGRLFYAPAIAPSARYDWAST